MNYTTALLKKNLELAGMFPFVLLGKICGRVFRPGRKTNMFFFFSNADIGGSIIVNADIIQCIKEQKPIVIFSKKPKNNKFRALFDIEGVQVLDLHKYIDNKLYHFVNFFFRGVIASWVNQAEKPVVFGGECLYFYKIIPHVKKETRRIELCHLNTWFNFSQAFVQYIDARIFSTPQIKREVEAQYKRNNVPEKYYERLHFADNKIDIPARKKIHNDVLQVVFIGRGSPQKRVHLVAAVAKKLKKEGVNAHVSFVGEMGDLIPKDVQEYCTMYGNINDPLKLKEIYDRSDVLLLTSAAEGLPIVVMEMMARGKAVVSTAVGGIPDYITHGENGFLVYEQEEQKIVDSSASYIQDLCNDRELLTKIGDNNHSYASAHFSGEHFCHFYRNMLLG